jgi:hypothetical protein
MSMRSKCGEQGAVRIQFSKQKGVILHDSSIVLFFETDIYRLDVVLSRER